MQLAILPFLWKDRAKLFLPWKHSKLFSVLFGTFFFNFKILEDMRPFCGATDTVFWTSGDVSSGFQSYSGFSCLYASLPMCNGFLRLTSGATPAYQLAAPDICTDVGSAQVQDHACHCLTLCDMTDALLTELSRLGSRTDFSTLFKGTFWETACKKNAKMINHL